MDNKTKNMLIGAMEECGKITQYCSKAIKFGLFSHHANKDKTNGDEILIKYYRLQAIIEALQHERVIPTYSMDYINNIKRDTLSKIKTQKNNHKGNLNDERKLRGTTRKR